MSGKRFGSSETTTETSKRRLPTSALPPLDLVIAAVAYCDAHKAEIDAWIELNARRSDAAYAAWLAGCATGQIVAALEMRLTEYPGDDDLANGESWI